MHRDGRDNGAAARDGAAGGPAAGTVTAVLVDAHAAVREGLPPLLAVEGVEVVGCAATAKAGATLVARRTPDVALVARRLPDADGIALVRRLVADAARAAAVVYGPVEDAEQAALAVHAGAAGLVATHRPVCELAAALRAVAAGGLWFADPDAEGAGPSPERLLAERAARRASVLSAAERRVLALVARGRSTEQVASALALSPHTVRTHLRNVMRKLGASSRAHAVAIAIREAAIEL